MYGLTSKDIIEQLLGKKTVRLCYFILNFYTFLMFSTFLVIIGIIDFKLCVILF